VGPAFVCFQGWVMVDRVKPLKLESADTGGTQDDPFPTSLDPNEDHVDARGVVFQDSTGSDETTAITRSGDDMTLKDVNNPTPLTLTQLLAAAGTIFDEDTIVTDDITGQVLVSDGGDVVVIP
jgi:hypothetical protein